MNAILERQKISRRRSSRSRRPVPSIVRRVQKRSLRRIAPYPKTLPSSPFKPIVRNQVPRFLRAPRRVNVVCRTEAGRGAVRIPLFASGIGSAILSHPKESILAVAAFLCLMAGALVSSSLSSRHLLKTIAAVPLPLEMETKTLLLSFFEQEPGETGEENPAVPSGLLVSSKAPIQYTVKAGDTLSGIAEAHGVDVGTLIRFNSIRDVRRIKAGTLLTIPPMSGILYTVRRGDSISLIAQKNGVSVNLILDANNLQSETIQPGQQLFIPGVKISRYEYDLATGQLFRYPVTGRLSSGFGYRDDPFTGKRRFHYGIDIANSVGTKVVAARDGEVVAVGSNNAYGNYLVIRHDNGFQTLYAHLDVVHARKGQWVRQGQWIADLGNTGRSTGPHLHFSLYKNNNAIDPLQYLH